MNAITAQQSTQQAAARDERLAWLLGHLTDHLRRGQHAEIDRLTAAHPDLAQELRELYAAMLVAEGAAASQSGEISRQSAASPALLDAAAATLYLEEVTAGRACGQSAAERPAASDPSGSGESPGDPSAGGSAADELTGDELTGDELTGDELTKTGPRRCGDYQLLEELGRGGMGVVYRARQLSLGREVAIKMLLAGQMASVGSVSRFAAEAQAVARLDHPHIVPIYEVGEQGSRPYFTMRLVAGPTLSDLLAAGPLDARQAAQLLEPVCRAIHYAHERGILHRDLKPSNILIDDQGHPLVSDFGLAKLVTANATLTQSGAIVGTPCHMAPEQAAGSRGRLSPATDVFSLGTILYQMLTGRPPFQAASPLDTMMLVLEQEPPPPRVLNPKANRELEMVALKCLQKPSELRYHSAAALADDLAAFLADEPISARSGRLGQVMARVFSETHHGPVLENWGLLWMWHSLVLLVISVATNVLQWRGTTSPWPYLGLWIVGLGTWAAIFWSLRRRAGPVTFIERQVAHLWAGGVASIAMLFWIEVLMGLPVLTLSPVLAISSGMVFVAKAGMLHGRFYASAVAMFATAAAMAWMGQHGIPWGITLYGVVSAGCFFVPGLKYYRQRRRGSA